MNNAQKLWEAANHIINSLDADLFFYAGEISRNGYDGVSEMLNSIGSNRKKNCGLFLNTLGGDPHAAYRIARAFGHHYDKMTLYVFGPCKSAGTLLSIGFNTIVIGDSGELGPMDVQLANREEILEYNSGLDMIQAMTWLQRHAKDSFKDFLKDMRHKERLNTKFASDTARQLTQGLFSGLYAHMDPVRLGYVQRTMLITEAYGQRLNKRSEILGSDLSLHRLVYEYPTHDFVIDRSEARSALFHKDRVLSPNEHERVIGCVLYRMNPGFRGVEVIHLNEALKPNLDKPSAGAKSEPVQRGAAVKTKQTAKRPTKSAAKKR